MRLSMEKAIEFVENLEKYHPIQKYWDESNERYRQEKNTENYPYSYFRGVLIHKIAEIIEAQQQEIDRLKEKLNAVLQDFYQYVQGGKELCAFCLHDNECEPGESKCIATYTGFKWRGLNEREDL